VPATRSARSPRNRNLARLPVPPGLFDLGVGLVPALAADVGRSGGDRALRGSSSPAISRSRVDLPEQGRQLAASGSIPKIVAGARKRSAQETAGRSRELHAERLKAARDRLDEAEQAVRDDAEIRVDLPAIAVPAGRTVLTVTGLTGTGWHPGTASLSRATSSLSRATPLLAQPAPQLLLLDEPTNNLDMASVRQLSQALEGYRGAILAASHDVPFLRSAGITRWLRLDGDVGMTVIEPL
jgi:hypothetical protein